jgi:tRNA-dihydrouridine synthase
VILAPLRGVTIRCFRDVYADEILSAGFTEAITPFISAMRGVDPLKDRELNPLADKVSRIKITPQFIGKDPEALRAALQRVKSAGYECADLNCGCPFPMVRNKGRGSGLLKTPDVLRRIVEVGVETMGEGKFSVKTRLGVDEPSELFSLIDVLNEFPLRFLTVHGRIARQMYDGECDFKAIEKISRLSKNKVIANGDLDWRDGVGMVGRSFIRHLGEMDFSAEALRRYISASRDELHGDRPVLGRIKELVAYWKDIPKWRSLWPLIKIARSISEFESCIV